MVIIFVILLLIIIVIPFGIVIVKSKKGKVTSKTKILGMSFKDFMTLWVAFWGLFGVFFGVIQVQRQISNQDNQIQIQKEQFENQIQIQQKQLRETRFSSGVELLGNMNESARIGGAYNLFFLANEYPDEYLIPVCEIFCAHIRTITSSKEYQIKHKTSNEIQTLINFLFKRNNTSLIFEHCNKNLQGTFLDGTNFKESKLDNVDFDYSTLLNIDFNYDTLTSVYCDNSKLKNITFRQNELFSVYIQDAEVTNVNFFNSELRNVRFGDSKLTNVKFPFSTLYWVRFDGAKLINIDFKYADIDAITLSGTILDGHKLEDIENRSRELTKKSYKKK